MHVHVCLAVWGRRIGGLAARLKIPPAAETSEFGAPTTIDPSSSTQQRPAYNHVSTVIHELCNEAAVVKAVDGTISQLVR